MKVTVWLLNQSQPYIFYDVDYVAQGPTMFQVLLQGGHFILERCKITSFRVERGERK